MELDESSRGPALRKLMKNKLGILYEWNKPEVIDRVGPYEPDIFDFFDQKRIEIVRKCEDLLIGFTNEQLDSLIDPDVPNDDALKTDWAKVYKREIENITRKEPPWYAGGFGVSAYEPDFRYWAQMPNFTEHEALLLTLGVAPDHFKEEAIINMQTKKERGTGLWAPLEYLLARREQIARQFRLFGRGHTITPNELFSWIEQVELDIHPSFSSRYVVQNTPQASGKHAKPMDDREKKSMLQLIISMAVGGYSYRPENKRSAIPNEIESDAAQLGISISAETVRKYLRASEKLISEDWEPPET